jgi:dCMP deaminase
MIHSKNLQELEEDVKEKHVRFDKVYMNIAKEIATLSHAIRSKVGAVLVKDGNIIAFGYNGTPSGFDNCCEIKTYQEVDPLIDVKELHDDPRMIIKRDNQSKLYPFRDSGGRYNLVTKPEVLHAEMNCILKAAKTGHAVKGATLYVTLSPCIECSKYILQSGVSKVVYLTEYRNKAGIDLLSQFIKIEKYEGVQ